MDGRQRSHVRHVLDIDGGATLRQAREGSRGDGAGAIDQPHRIARLEPAHARMVRFALTELGGAAWLQPLLAEEGRYTGRATTVHHASSVSS
jgi:hypothetical protein